MKKIILVLALAALALAGYRIYDKIQKKKDGGQKQNGAAPVEVAKSIKADLWDTVSITGDVHGYFEAKAFPQVSGKISRRVRNAGEKTRKYEILATIDRDEPALKYSFAEVKSPLAGIITRYYVDEGETVSPATPVAEVATVDKIKVIVQIAERDLAKIRIGQDARFAVDSYPGMRFPGKVHNVSRALDSTTRTSTVEILADNPKEVLRPGMFAKVEILVARHTGSVIVPRAAVIFNAGADNEVFVIKSDKAEKRTVVAGLQTSEVIEIISGVQENEDVVTLGQYSLTDGARVNICQNGVCPVPE